MTISADKLRTAPAVKRERVDLPEFGDGEFVWVHQMTAGAHIEIEAWLIGSDNKVDRRKMAEFKQRQIVASLRDDDGNLILTADDVAAVGAWPSEVFERLHDVVHRINGGNGPSKKNDEATETGS